MPVSPVGAIIDRPHQSASVNVPAISVGRAESARRFVEAKLIVAAALLKPPYRGAWVRAA